MAARLLRKQRHRAPWPDLQLSVFPGRAGLTLPGTIRIFPASCPSLGFGKGCGFGGGQVQTLQEGSQAFVFYFQMQRASQSPGACPLRAQG